MRKNSVKNIRINEEVLRELSNIIRSDLKDPRVQGKVVTVLSVEVAPDLKTAKVYLSVLGDDAEAEKVMEGIKSSAGYIRREIAHRLNLRNTPEFTYILDQSIAYAIDMTKKIDEVMGTAAS